MAKFNYITQKAKNGAFEIKTLIADNMTEAEKQLMDKQVPVLVLERPLEKKAKKIKSPSVKSRELLTFAQQMSATQNIEMNVLDSLELCREMIDSKDFKVIIAAMKTDIESGKTLHDAMRNSKVFDDLTLGLVFAGEQGGFLGKSFEQIKDMLERNSTIKKKVVGLMWYPLIVFVIAAGIIFFLMWKTVPVFMGLFSGSKVPLPMPTQILIAGSKLTTAHPFLIFMSIAAVGYGILSLPKIYRRFPKMHRYVLKMPVIGPLQKKLINETFTRTLLNLNNANMNTIEALSLCRSISPCYDYKAAIARAILIVSRGGGIMGALETEKDIFGLLIIRALGFGERTGKTTEVLKPLSEELTKDINNYIENLKTVLEPFMTLFIGGIVFGVMLAMFLPIFDLTKVI